MMVFVWVLLEIYEKLVCVGFLVVLAADYVYYKFVFWYRNNSLRGCTDGCV